MSEHKMADWFRYLILAGLLTSFCYLIFVLFAANAAPEEKQTSKRVAAAPKWNGRSMMAAWISELGLENVKLTCKQEGNLAYYCTLAYDDSAGRRVLQDVVCINGRMCHLQTNTTK